MSKRTINKAGMAQAVGHYTANLRGGAIIEGKSGSRRPNGPYAPNLKGGSIIEGKGERGGEDHKLGGKMHRADSRRELGMKDPLTVKDWTD